ncbi:MAG: PCRF domain-containing protein [Patescibacteria group bacterium]
MDYLESEISRIEQEIERAKALVSELGEEAEQEIKRLEEQRAVLVKAMEEPSSLESSDEPMEDFNSVIVEIRGGVGGDEGKIWGEDLGRMYARYATIMGWKVVDLDEGVMGIKGKNVFSQLKYETGVHRVQRVPETEAQGRIHTSTASVVVLPEVPEKLIEIKDDDLHWEFVRGGGHGGQNVNKVATTARLTHLPTGIVVKASQERFQEQNRKIALSMLRAQLWEIEQEKKMATLAGQRLAIGKNMRSEKIRTYNYPQNRVTDHRIGKSWHKLDKILEGDISDIIETCSSIGSTG